MIISHFCHDVHCLMLEDFLPYQKSNFLENHANFSFPGPGFYHPDGGYPVDENNVFRMGPVFISLAIFVFQYSFSFIALSPKLLSLSVDIMLDRNRFHPPDIRHPDNKIPTPSPCFLHNCAALLPLCVQCEL